MVELETPRLDNIFHALGDATRRRMLRELADGERTVSELAKPFAISLAILGGRELWFSVAASRLARRSKDDAGKSHD